MNKLLQVRKLYGLTQPKVAEILGVSLRTYQRYEVSNNNSKKIDNMVRIIESTFTIDEEHGLLSTNSIITAVEPILSQHGISVCYLFGSYAKGNPKGTSDVDLLIDIAPKGIEYFSLVEELRVALKKKVDLITVKQLTSSPDLLTEILKFGKKIYERK